MSYQYLLRDRIFFYWRYFLLKTWHLWFEVKTPRLKMFVYEMMYSLKKLGNPASLLPSPFKTDLVETVFGKFRIRPRTVDMSNASPAFERGDIDHLLLILDKMLREGMKVLLFDIGSDLGTFSITAGNRFKGCKLHIMAFEPAASSFALLSENISLNNLDAVVEACNFALYSEDNRELNFHFNGLAPGSSGLSAGAAAEGAGMQKVIARTLDSVVGGRAEDYDAIIFKMDVEGVEAEVLKGAQAVLNSGRQIFIMAEDFVNPEIIGFLEDMGAEFVTKITPYNSWWKYRACSR